MAEDLQGLLEKINRDGIEKANATAEALIAEAKKSAATIIAEAEAKAEKLRVSAKADAEADTRRAEETIRQAARDTMIEIEHSVGALLEKVLIKGVDQTLADETALQGLILEAIKGINSSVEVALPVGIADALRAKLAATGQITVIADPTVRSGFSVRIDGGRIEHAFTGKAVSDEIIRRLRPELAKILN